MEAALRKLGKEPYRIDGFLTKPHHAIEKLGPVDDPMIGICVHWFYGPHTTEGVVGKENPLLLASNFSGQWPGLVGLLNTGACLESLNRKYSRVWTDAPDWTADETFMDRLEEWCSSGEILAYARALKGRRDKMYFGFSWYECELRFPDWRTKAKLIEGFDNGLQQAGLDYVDVWRVSALMNEPQPDADMEAMMEAFDVLHEQGKVRFLGLSSHHHGYLKHAIETWPQIAVILFPYTASSKELPEDSLFGAVREQDVGVFGIKPFASNSIFKGDSQPGNPVAEQDDELARLTIRYILGNPAITAPIPGLISTHQVDNVVRAVQESRELSQEETAALEAAAREMTARLPSGYQFLRDWEWV